MMILELFGGLVYLLLGGDLLVRGSVALAKRADIPPMVVGLTIVAFGTSAPELFISLSAAFSGYPGISIGNVVGSNVANVLLVMGVPALIHPLLCEEDSLGTDTAIMLFASLVFVGLCFLGPLGSGSGLLLLAMLVAVLLRSLSQARRSPESEAAAEEELERVLGLPTSRRMIGVFVLLGLVGLPLGAHLLVDGAVKIAESFGISEAVIGLSIVAIGTSLPELATTVVAAMRRHSDVALGNVIGSNQFNLLAIMGITATVSPQPIPVPEFFLRFDLFVMLAAATLLAAMAWTRASIGRTKGIGLLLAYGLYLAAMFYRPAA